MIGLFPQTREWIDNNNCRYEGAKGCHESMMKVVGVGKSKQKCMCCFNATDMNKSEEYGWGDKMKDGMY